MIKRPLNARFSEAVLEGRKITTIRDKAWEVGVPVMLYNWSGLPYRSKQRDVAAVIVEDTTPIRIERDKSGSGAMRYFPFRWWRGRELWECEGFGSAAEMDEWFRGKVKPGARADKILMRFRLMTCADSDAYFQTYHKLP